MILLVLLAILVCFLSPDKSKTFTVKVSLCLCLTSDICSLQMSFMKQESFSRGPFMFAASTTPGIWGW